MSNFKQGTYTPIHPEKYMGDISKIRYMSSYELEMHKFLDGNPNVKRWGYEIVIVPYIKPTDGRMHKYIVDYVVEYVTKHGEIRTELIEVKPQEQTRAPRKNHKHHLYEAVQFEINKSKWAAASLYAKQQGWTFKIITQRSIFK